MKNTSDKFMEWLMGRGEFPFFQWNPREVVRNSAGNEALELVEYLAKHPPQGEIPGSEEARKSEIGGHIEDIEPDENEATVDEVVGVGDEKNPF